MNVAASHRPLMTGIILAGVLLLVGSIPLTGTSDASTFSSQVNPVAPPHACSGMPVASTASVIYSTGAPDGGMAMASSPASVSLIETEAADDFVVTGTVRIDSITFTGLFYGSGSFGWIQDIQIEIYRVFPGDSVNPPSGTVPTRENSPSDVAFVSRRMSAGELTFFAYTLARFFRTYNSVINGIHPIPNQTTGGDGPVTGQEVQFDVTLTTPIELSPGHYFLVPKVQWSGGDFLWLSAAGPTLTDDLQAWARNSNLAPDWLRVGTDIVGGTTPPKFNASFSLCGTSSIFLPVILR